MSYTARDYWKAFGKKRFTKADLWQAFGHNQFPGFPTPEWLVKLGIEQMEWIEAAPGPRGGQGWRLTTAAVVSLQIADAKANAKEERLQALLNAVTPRLGNCHISDGKLKWSYFPPVPLLGSQLGGRRRNSATEMFILTWPSTSRPTSVQAALDRAAVHIATLAERKRKQCLAELEKLDSLIAQR